MKECERESGYMDKYGYVYGIGELCGDVVMFRV